MCVLPQRKPKELTQGRELATRRQQYIAEYMKKGRQIMVEGRLKQDRWEAQDGKKMSKVRVTVESFTFVGARPGGEGGAPAPKGGGAPAAGPEEGPPPGQEEDIPF